MAAPLPGRHRDLIAGLTRDLRDLLSNGGGHKKRPSAQDRPLKICFTKRFAAIENKAKQSSHLLHTQPLHLHLATTIQMTLHHPHLFTQS